MQISASCRDHISFTTCVWPKAFRHAILLAGSIPNDSRLIGGAQRGALPFPRTIHQATADRRRVTQWSPNQQGTFPESANATPTTASHDEVYHTVQAISNEPRTKHASPSDYDTKSAIVFQYSTAMHQGLTIAQRQKQNPSCFEVQGSRWKSPTNYGKTTLFFTFPTCTHYDEKTFSVLLLQNFWR